MLLCLLLLLLLLLIFDDTRAQVSRVLTTRLTISDCLFNASYKDLILLVVLPVLKCRSMIGVFYDPSRRTEVSTTFQLLSRSAKRFQGLTDFV